MEDDTMLTKFGKELKKIRVEHDEILKDMAAKLGVTAAYLSAVENGNRKVPDTWVGIISNKYQLTEEEAVKLQSVAYENRNSVKITYDNSDKLEADLALSFARKFKELDKKDVLEIQKILKRIGG